MVNLVRWNPYQVMEMRPFVSPFGLLEEVEEMARRAFEDTHMPSVEVEDKEKELVVKAKLPGLRKKELNITLKGDVLTVKAEKTSPKKTRKTGHDTGEHFSGQYLYRMTLPARVDEEKVTATLKKGQLEIRLPKAEIPAARQIEVKTK